MSPLLSQLYSYKTIVRYCECLRRESCKDQLKTHRPRSPKRTFTGIKAIWCLRKCGKYTERTNRYFNQLVANQCADDNYLSFLHPIKLTFRMTYNIDQEDTYTICDFKLLLLKYYYYCFYLCKFFFSNVLTTFELSFFLYKKI